MFGFLAVEEGRILLKTFDFFMILFLELADFPDVFSI